MKVDVIACYYRQAKYAPLFWWGIEQNREHINRVFVADDEIPEQGGEFAVVGGTQPFTYLCHPHVGHGVSISFNQAMRASKADYVFLMSFDQILPPGGLAKILDYAHPDYMVVGAVHTISKDTTVYDLPRPQIIRPDYLLKKIQHFKETRRQWAYGRNGHTLLHRETALALGGFDEEFARIGYGLEDFEFAARFAQAKGLDNILWGPSESWHFGDEEPSRDNPAKQEKPEAFTKLAASLAPLYERRFALFAGEYPHPLTHVCVRNPGTSRFGDFPHNCYEPTWLPEGLNEIITTCDTDEHLAILRSKLSPDGAIIIVNPAKPAYAGFDCIPEGDRMTLLVE